MPLFVHGHDKSVGNLYKPVPIDTNSQRRTAAYKVINLHTVYRLHYIRPAQDPLPSARVKGDDTPNRKWA